MFINNKRYCYLISNNNGVLSMKEFEIEDTVRQMMTLDEEVLYAAQQYRITPEGPMTTPDKLYVTSERIIYREPWIPGTKKSFKEYYLKDISNIRMKKGTFSTEIYLKSRILSDEVVLPTIQDNDAIEITRIINEKLPEKERIFKMEQLEREKISKFNYCIDNKVLPSIILDGSTKIIVKPNEKIHFYAPDVRFAEERSVRRSYGGGIRVMKGVYLGASQSEHHGEIREIDDGELMLTNQRLVFSGKIKKIEYPLKKIITIEEYKNGISIGFSSRNKAQIFCVPEPQFWAPMIRTAIDIYVNGIISESSEKQEQTKKYCTKCGTVMDFQYEFCGKCGNKL